MRGKYYLIKVLFIFGQIISIFGTGNIFAKRFANEYTQFELPAGWTCQLEGSEWVCQSNNDQRKKEAIIILVAKIRGPQDSLEQYLAYLKQPKTYSLPGGKTQVSEAKYFKTNSINSHAWVDALHLASEVPGFYTRYLATVKEDLGVAVTFSVSKDHYQSYQGIFDNVVKTLRVFRQKKKLAYSAAGGADSSVIENIEIPEDLAIGAGGARKKSKKSTGGGGSDSLMLLVGLAVAGGAFFMWKKKSGKKKKKKKKKTEE